MKSMMLWILSFVFGGKGSKAINTAIWPFPFPMMELIMFLWVHFWCNFIYSLCLEKSQLWSLKCLNSMIISLRKLTKSVPAYEFVFSAKAEENVVCISVMLSLRWLVCSDSGSNWLISPSHIFVSQWNHWCLIRDLHSVGQEVPQAIFQLSITSWPSSENLEKTHSIYFTHKVPTAKLRC